MLGQLDAARLHSAIIASIQTICRLQSNHQASTNSQCQWLRKTIHGVHVTAYTHIKLSHPSETKHEPKVQMGKIVTKLGDSLNFPRNLVTFWSLQLVTKLITKFVPKIVTKCNTEFNTQFGDSQNWTQNLSQKLSRNLSQNISLNLALNSPLNESPNLLLH